MKEQERYAIMARAEMAARTYGPVDAHIPDPVMQETPLRWLVPSETNYDKTYLVDLGANNGIGQCVCKGFEITCVKQMKEQPGTISRCRHIRSARTALRNKLFAGKDPLDLLIQMLKDKDQNHDI
jgi:hypothetical protein